MSRRQSAGSARTTSIGERAPSRAFAYVANPEIADAIGMQRQVFLIAFAKVALVDAVRPCSDGSGRRGKQLGTHARRFAKARSLTVRQKSRPSRGPRSRALADARSMVLCRGGA